jgi:hypothetical protein
MERPVPLADMFMLHGILSGTVVLAIWKWQWKTAREMSTVCRMKIFSDKLYVSYSESSKNYDYLKSVALQLSVRLNSVGGMQYRSWLRPYATSQKVAGSIPDEVIGSFSWPNPSRCTMALGSIQPLTEMSTRNIPGGKKAAGRWVRLTTPLSSVSRLSHNPTGLHGLL